jgi:hypothetical protein
MAIILCLFDQPLSRSIGLASLVIRPFEFVLHRMDHGCCSLCVVRSGCHAASLCMRPMNTNDMSDCLPSWPTT